MLCLNYLKISVKNAKPMPKWKTILKWLKGKPFLLNLLDTKFLRSKITNAEICRRKLKLVNAQLSRAWMVMTDRSELL